MPGTRAQDTDASKTIFRSDRICRINGEFYFSTREATLEGPFNSREEAEQEIAAYIQRMIQFSKITENPVARELAPAGPQSGPPTVHP
ncbi:hypothetical protein HU806_05810 [Pseudomonas sp. SWRI154]|nr:hypothetical protein [Pseudomonas sp. SWRI154]